MESMEDSNFGANRQIQVLPQVGTGTNSCKDQFHGDGDCGALALATFNMGDVLLYYNEAR